MRYWQKNNLAYSNFQNFCNQAEFLADRQLKTENMDEFLPFSFITIQVLFLLLITWVVFAIPN